MRCETCSGSVLRGQNAPSLPSPASVGLSQMSKEVEEEVLSPSSEVHFSAYRSIIGVCPQDVDRDSAYDCKILWPVILAGPGVVLIEDNVERPMQLIFDGPMCPEHFEHALGRQTFG